MRVSFEGRSIIKHAPTITKNVEQKIASMPKPDFSSFTDTKYYKGGFEKKMTRREAALILGVRWVLLFYLFLPGINSNLYFS